MKILWRVSKQGFYIFFHIIPDCASCVIFLQADLPYQNTDYDYALYELANAIRLGSIGPLLQAWAVYLPNLYDDSQDPKTYMISGWGSLSATATVSPKELHAAKVWSMPWDHCQKILWKTGKPSLTNRQLCTKTVGLGTRPAPGDSGGSKPS